MPVKGSDVVLILVRLYVEYFALEGR